MGKYLVISTAHTPADRVREALGKVERLIPNLRGTGPQALELLHLLDQTADGLAKLEAAGVDIRAERARFESVQQQLRHRPNRFLAEVGVAFQEERAAVQPDRAHWWWFLDEILAQQRVRQFRRWLAGILIGALLLVGAWLVYDRFVAPPPEVRQAFQHSADGESLVGKGDLRAALTEFEAAAALTPDDPLPWIWRGVIHVELNEPDAARVAFETARSLYKTNFDFLLERGLIYLRVGDLVAASADAEQAILENPGSGQGYYLRATIATEQKDYAAAIADLERAAELAQAAGDAQLEAAARVQRAMVVQLQTAQ